MRKVIVLVISLLLIASLTTAVLAEPKPAPEYIPQPVETQDIWPGVDPWDFWVELNPDDGGNGYELPGDNYQSGALGWIRGGGWGFDPTSGRNLYHGIPIGFNFKFMQGPAEGVPVYKYTDYDQDGSIECEPDPPGNRPECEIVAWNTQLLDTGWDEIWVGTKGYTAFHEPVPHLRELSAIKWNQMPSEVPLPWPPNNMIAPFLTDLAIGDNDFDEVTKVCFRCTVRDPDGVCIGGFYQPCEWRRVHVPRGRLLYRTVGDAPNRKFVVEWANAKVYWGSGFATFQLQLWEERNLIAFFYKDFKPLAFYEDPPHAAAFPLWDTLVVGMEDSFGTTGVGQAFGGTPDFSPDGWQFFNPLNELDIMVFAADAYP
jgi:hypothetical protein